MERIQLTKRQCFLIGPPDHRLSFSGATFRVRQVNFVMQSIFVRVVCVPVLLQNESMSAIEVGSSSKISICII